MRMCFLTSSPMGAYRSSSPPSFTGLDPANGLTEELSKYWKPQSKCLLVSAFPDEYELNERMRGDFERILRETGLSLSHMDLCDRRNGKEKAGALSSYDAVFLGGGHVPTQNAFFHEIGLPAAFRSWNGIVMGISAGSMNCAAEVYAQPELPGEAKSGTYRRFLPGLGLTDCNILPHYQAVRDDYVDGMRLFEEITYPDSIGHRFYAIPDGSYLLHGDGRKEIRGEAYRIADGEIHKICRNGETYYLK